MSPYINTKVALFACLESGRILRIGIDDTEPRGDVGVEQSDSFLVYQAHQLLRFVISHDEFNFHREFACDFKEAL